jgi:SNF2 family DNA or RNA helicase
MQQVFKVIKERLTIHCKPTLQLIVVLVLCRCAVVLRDLISPYLLRRRKADVATQLPKKTETVLFCSLTETQRDLYRSARGSWDSFECVLPCTVLYCAVVVET